MVDDVLQIDQVDHYYLHLKPSTADSKLLIKSVYRKLDLPHIIEEADRLKELSRV